MSHGDKLVKLPEGFHTIATTANSEYAGIAHETKPVYGNSPIAAQPFSYLLTQPQAFSSTPKLQYDPFAQ